MDEFPERFDLVHPALLVPPDGPIRSSCRTDAGLVLDRELIALSGVDARCRLIRARIVAQILARRAWRALGFVRLGDYARERLGVSPRSLEEDARIVRALDVLPAMRTDLESGSLAWTRARLLLRAATAENEAALLQESSRIPYRDLEEWVREFRVRSEVAMDGNDVVATPTQTSTAVAPPASGILDDPIVRWSVSLSRSGRRMWKAACEYASRAAGTPLSPGQVLELVAAEVSGVASAPGAQVWKPSPEDHERRLRSRLHAREARGRRSLLGFLAETGVAEGFPWLEPNSRAPGPATALDCLSHGLDDADGLDLERRLQILRELSQRTDAQMAALLRIGVDRRLFQEIGFASIKLYVEARLGMSARRAWSLVAIERDSWRKSHRLHEAWKDGRLTQLQALALLPVLNEQNASAWVERAGEVTLRRLHDEVAWALDHGQGWASGDQRMPPASDAVVRAEATADVSMVEVQNRAHGDAPDEWQEPAGAVRIDICAPLSVVVMVESVLDRLERPIEARWQVFERMVALALLEWMATPRHRDVVFERDGWRCAVPGCSSRRNLHDHHVVFRSHGGGNSHGNRITVCAAHHLHAIHAGIVQAEGRAPDAIRWTMPLGRLVGDRYAERI